VFEAAHRALRELEPALLVVDDLQWLDELSLALCHYLIRAACDAAHHIAVFAASRLDESGSALGESLPRGRVVRIDLGPLGRNEGVELALASTRLDSIRGGVRRRLTGRRSGEASFARASPQPATSCSRRGCAEQVRRRVVAPGRRGRR
jgi:hypothetical protein